MKKWPMVSFLAAFPLAAAVSAPQPAAPPPSRIAPVTDTLHGVAITDNYRWLEGDDKGGMTDEVKAWTDAQNGLTRRTLDGLSGRKALQDRLRPLMEVGTVTAPVMRDNRYFYLKREGSENQASLFLRIGPGGAPRKLLDPGTIDKTGLVTLSWFEPNYDGTLLAFGMYRSGDENSVLYVMEVDSGNWRADEISGKVNNMSWLPDSTGFIYRRLSDLKNPYSGEIRYHKLGGHPRQDPLLFRQYTPEENKDLATTYGPYASVSRDGRWLILIYFTGTRSNDLWCVDLDRWRRTGEFVKTPILTDTLHGGASAQGPVAGDTLYLVTTLDAPHGRGVAVDLNHPEMKNWRTIIPERADAVLQGLSAARGMLVADFLHNASSRIEKFSPDGAPLGALELPGIGTASVTTGEERTEAFLEFESYNEPHSIYRIDLAAPGRTLWERPKVPVDPSTVEVKQVWVPSKDGTKISMFIVHRKGLKLDGNNPVMLNGYGGFNVSETPFFSATLFPWFEAGGVFALPNLRGGGEYGEAWHRGGMLENKQNVFDDFIAAAEWLEKNGYSNPRRLAITGGSNGGLLTGAALTQRPELFGAVISAVPLLDMLRYQNFLMAKYWVPEYGSSEDPAQFAWLRKYSPYQNARPGVKYPAVLLTAGENDARVHPLHARKMTALLQAGTASDAKEKPVLLWVDRDAGHGQGKPLNLRLRDLVDQRIFMMWQLGMLNLPADATRSGKN